MHIRYLTEQPSKQCNCATWPTNFVSRERRLTERDFNLPIKRKLRKNATASKKLAVARVWSICASSTLFSEMLIYFFAYVFLIDGSISGKVTNLTSKWFPAMLSNRVLSLDQIKSYSWVCSFLSSCSRHTVHACILIQLYSIITKDSWKRQVGYWADRAEIWEQFGRKLTTL